MPTNDFNYCYHCGQMKTYENAVPTFNIPLIRTVICKRSLLLY